MDLHPEAAATMSALTQTTASDPLAAANSTATPVEQRRVDDGLQLRARLLKMIVAQEQARKSSADVPR